jgi:hypothetical protein
MLIDIGRVKDDVEWKLRGRQACRSRKRIESNLRRGRKRKEKVSEIETVQHFNDRVDEGIIAAPEKLRSHRTV